MTQNPHIGTAFSDFLRKEGFYEEATAHAIERVSVWRIAQAIKTSADRHTPRRRPRNAHAEKPNVR
jgi:hypothetical protein